MLRFKAVIDISGDPRPFETAFYARTQAQARQMADDWIASCPFAGRVIAVLQAPRRQISH